MQHALAAGSVAPAFSLPDHGGIVHSLSDGLRKGPLLLIFFKISCPTCQYALPFFDRLYKQLRQASVTIWGISQNSLDHTDAFAREFKLESFPTLFDPDEEEYPVSEAYEIANVPTVFLVGQDGKIALTCVGWSKGDFEVLAQRLAGAAGDVPLSLFEPGEKVIEFQPGCASKN